jgi:hypothetical protein
MSYWLTPHNTGSTKSPYAMRVTLGNKPDNMEDIEKWLLSTFGKFGYLLKVYDSMYYAEIFLKNESDATALVLQWGESLQDKPVEE